MSLSRMDKQERRQLLKYMQDPFIEGPKPWEREKQASKHWYARYKAGYRPKAWPKRNDDCDDDRFNLVESEYNNEP